MVQKIKLNPLAKDGAKILFFSGGSALKSLSHRLKRYTHNSIHLITAFDSGGSSGVLREHFGIAAVGDIRSRLVALADENILGVSAAQRLLSHRLVAGSSADLEHDLRQLAAQNHSLIRDLPTHFSEPFSAYLNSFIKVMPVGFDLNNACIGNLIITGAWLDKGDLTEALSWLATRLGVLGQVQLITSANCHLAAETQRGRVLGQHNITKQTSVIKRVCLSKSIAELEPCNINIAPVTAASIEAADLICYPHGSFYTSLIATLLPKGVADAICRSRAPKVYIPNLGFDSEQQGKTLAGCVETLLQVLRHECGQDTPVEALLNIVLLDVSAADYYTVLDLDYLASIGVTVLDRALVKAPTQYDDQLLVKQLLDIAHEN